MAAPKKVDYEQIEPGWRAGLKSPGQLAREYAESTGVQISHVAIIKHFKRLGVPRDLSAKVTAKADRMVTESMVTGKVATLTTKADAILIDTAALEVATIRVDHRKDIKRSRKLAMGLLEELEVQTVDIALFEELGELLRNEDDKGIDKRNDIYNKVISSASRITSMRALAETLKTLVGLEREAYGIVTGDSGQQKPDIPAGLGHFYGEDE